MPRIVILRIEVFGEQVKVQMPRPDEIFYLIKYFCELLDRQIAQSKAVKG